MIDKIKILLGTGLFSGYVPFVPGTAGSAVALLVYFIPGFRNLSVILPMIISFFFIGIPLGSYFESKYGNDPQIFTLDEIVGTWISLLIVPEDIILILAAFIIWRILDIVKPFPAKSAEKLRGGIGIMLDDVVSAMYSLIIIYIFKILFYQ
jgi:phosphatidylglycerophosphatase A